MPSDKEKTHTKRGGLTRSSAPLVSPDTLRQQRGPKHREQTDLPPWKLWKLDENFLTALSQWTLKHPENSLDRSLEKMRDGLENSKDLLDLIPSGEFPARELVAALGYLLKLGADISLAKKDVQEFSNEVVKSVNQLLQGFNHQGSGYFTGKAWQSLKDLRDIVDEICSWALDRLQDDKIGWWTGFKRKFNTGKDIQEFRQQIKNAKEQFKELAFVALAEASDRTTQSLQHHEAMLVENNNSQRVQAKNLGQLSSSIKLQEEADDRKQFLAEALDPYTVSKPTYDNHGKRPCDKDTRAEILDEIQKWVNDIAPGSQNFLWLTGIPGSGKSAVTASLARECKDRKILWAQYFITRTDAATTNPKKYFPSIARQLADRSTEVANTIRDTLKEAPSLTDDISTDQAAALFTNSVRKASQLDPNQPVVIVIDGLDETDQDRLGVTAKIFSTLFTSLKAFGNVKVFISSRTENEIQKSFIPSSNIKHVKHILLDTADPASVRDVSNYMKWNLINLSKEHGLTWDTWPGDERFEVLKQRAAGLFIWGVTAVKFIQAKLQDDGQEILDSVLDMLVAGALTDINDLYLLVIRNVLGDKPSEWALERFRRIIGTILFVQEPLCVGDLATLLDLREQPSSPRVDIIHFMRRFRTILVAETGEINLETIPRTHKSVFEFFISHELDTKYRVEPHRAHLEIALQCLAHLGAAHELTKQSPLSKSFLFARKSWSFHLSQADILGPGLVCADYRHLPPSSIPLLLPGSLKQPIQIRAGSLRRAETSIVGYTQPSRKGYPLNAIKWILPLSSTSELPYTSITFSSDARQLFCLRDDTGLTVCDVKYCPWVRQLAESLRGSYRLALSSDDKVIVTGSYDGSIRRWNSSSGAQIGVRWDSDAPEISCVDFSPDGKKLIVGSRQICVLWNMSTGKPIGEPWTGHKRRVRLIAFSGSGRHVCSADDECYLIWDVTTGKQISTSHRIDRFTLECISFSPKNDDVLALGHLLGIEISFGHSKWSETVGKVFSLRFAPDGRTIIFATKATLFVAAVDEAQATARIVRQGDFYADRLPFSLAFSRNLDYFARYSQDALDIYTLHHNKTSLDLVPVKGSIPSVQATDGNRTLTHVLSNLEEVQSRHKTTIKNRRIDGIKWYRGSDDVAQSFGKVLVVTDSAIIAVDKDDLVSVWKLGKEPK